MRRALALACAALVSSAALGAVPAPRAIAGPDDGEAVLKADADGPLRIRREGGVATFVGTPAGTDIDNPAVGRGTSVSAAARAHLQRYGDAIGADRAGTRLVEHGRSSAAAGSAVVRYQQEVDGLPVLGGDVVVTLDKDHDLASLDANLSDAASVGSATVTEDAARATALGTVGRTRVKGATAEDLGRWVLDPETIPVAGLSQARSAWRFEVRAGHDVRRMVLVDDRSGVVLLDVDLIQEADRVVCDRANANPVYDPPVCKESYARTEVSGPSKVADVNLAFANAGRVSTFYSDFGTPAMQDLTNLIGHDSGDGKKLRSTVRVCIKDVACPYDNAYWNGEAMFYGAGYPRADDIVGHEMTHGVIENTSGLIYYDQSGAINESLADIIGEIIDHRTGTDDDSAFYLGEDLPGDPFRSMKNPPQFRDPDRVTSPYWYSGEIDSGGVHWNSGVSNKAFYLISKGGSFNGQSIAGIDAGDPLLADSAKLWVQVIATVSAFTTYADLATVLEQACATLQAGGDLTATDCGNVHKVVLATEMTKRPTAEPVRDASRTCPGGMVRQVLFDAGSEAEQAAFTAPAGGWTRLPDAGGVVPNAYSGDTAWYAEDDQTGAAGVVAHRPLQGPSWVQVPPGRTFIAFRHWHTFEYTEDYTTGSRQYWDGGTFEVLREGSDTIPLERFPWTNGPTKQLSSPGLAARKAFAASSKGWVGSRVEISDLGAQKIRPQFTMHYDEAGGAPGWYVDDVEIYNCAPVYSSPAQLNEVGTMVGWKKSVIDLTWVDPATVTTYQWRRSGVNISGATQASYTPVVADLGKVLSVVVTGTAPTGPQPAPFVLSAGTVRLGIFTPPPKVQALGTAAVGRRLTATPGSWWPGGIAFTYQWLRDGRAISGATARTYLIRRTDKGHRISVRITARKPGFKTIAITSAGRLVTR